MGAANAGISPTGTHQNEVFAEESVGTGQGGSNVTRWALTDHQGTVRAVISNSGTLLDNLTYSAFGTLAAQTAPGEALRMAYTGYVLDGETGLSYANARWLDTTQGRWLSVDPMGFAAGDTNLYRYVGNDAMGGTDPTGLGGLGRGATTGSGNAANLEALTSNPMGRAAARKAAEEAARRAAQDQLLQQQREAAARLAQRSLMQSAIPEGSLLRDVILWTTGLGIGSMVGGAIIGDSTPTPWAPEGGAPSGVGPASGGPISQDSTDEDINKQIIGYYDPLPGSTYKQPKFKTRKAEDEWMRRHIQEAIRLREAEAEVARLRAEYKLRATKDDCPERNHKWVIDIRTMGGKTAANIATNPKVKEDILKYAILSNEWFNIHGAQYVKPTGAASPKIRDFDENGSPRVDASGNPQLKTLREWAEYYAKEQRFFGSVYTRADLVAGHVPDVCITGSPDPLKVGGYWWPMEKTANSAVAGYEAGHMIAKPGQPVNFFTVDGKDPLAYG
jgi:RHS repeat-associated protein